MGSFERGEGLIHLARRMRSKKVKTRTPPEAGSLKPAGCGIRSVSGANCAEQMSQLIAAKGDEMKIALADQSFEVFWHEGEAKSEEGPTLCEEQKRKG